MRATLSLLPIYLLLILLGIPVHALESWTLYDTFDSTFLDPKKWVGEEKNSGAIIVESVREIYQKRLLLRNRTYGRKDSDFGSTEGGTRLYLAKGERITAITAKVKINEVEAKSCSSRERDTFATFRLGGFFFNTDLSIANSALNDVFAQFMIQQQSGVPNEFDTLEAIAQVQKCTNSDCTSYELIESRKVGTVRLWGYFRPTIQLDQEKSRFIFQLGAEPPVYIPYKVADKSPPGIQNDKHIEILQVVPNCTEGSTPVAYMDVFIEHVFVNRTALP